MANSNLQYQGADLDTLLVPKSAVWQPGEKKPIYWWGSSNGTATSSPIQVGSMSDWIDVLGYDYSGYAINGSGVMHSITGSPPQSSQYSTATTFSSFFTNGSGRGYLAVASNNALWAWGENGAGQLGLETITNVASPTQVGSLTNWASGSTCGQTTVAVKTDGTLWSWGYNNNGQLGQNDRTHRSSPTQVGSLSNWKQVYLNGDTGFATTFAIKTDGTLWGWGSNGNAILGLSNTTNYSSPVQIGSLTNWNKISGSTGGYNSMYAVKTDGTLWTWGTNKDGKLGLGNSTSTTSYSSPVQIGTLTDWSNVYGAGNQAFAIKTDGTLWSWGSNFQVGQLGLNNLVHRSSPTQVGSLTSWYKVSSGTVSTNQIVLAMQSI